METQNKTDLSSALKQLETTLETYLVKKAPYTIPSNIKEMIVNFSPWILLLMIILTLPMVLALFGLGAVLLPFSFLGGVQAGLGFSSVMIFSLIILVLQAIALPGLFKRAKSSWNFLFYASLVSAVSNIVSFNLGGLVIGSLLTWYILFQVKEYYK